MTVRDGERDLPVQLAALSRQDPSFGWELVAVDDGSTDGTRRLLEGAVGDGLPIRILPSRGVGVGAARNIGVRDANGSLVVFLDHDDEIEPGYLEAMVTALRRHEFVAARLDTKTLNPGWVGEYRPPPQETSISHDFRPFAAGCSLGIRRDVFDRLGGFDPALSGPEDRDLCFRAALAGVDLVFVPDAVVRYRFRDDLRSIYRQSRRGGRATVELFARYRDQGMQARLIRAEGRRWLDLLVDAVKERERIDRARQAHRLGQLVGHIQGCVISRVWWFKWG